MATLAVPSYLVPGTWLENLDVMEAIDWIEGVELLFFAYDDDARTIFGRERGAIADWSSRFSFSLHLPDPLGGDAEELVEATRSFVDLYVVHPPKNEVEEWAGTIAAWRERYGDDFLVEYTGGGQFSAAEAALPGLPLCADTGRLLLDGESPARWIAERSGRVRELHLHAVAAAEGRDHAPLAGSEPWLAELRPLLASSPFRTVLEVFSLAGVEASRRALKSMEGRETSKPTGEKA